MEARGWKIFKLHGNKFQIGLPDLLCMHPLHGVKWIETKVPHGKVRPSQARVFSIFADCNVQVYILHDEKDYPLIFNEKGNWVEHV